MHSYVVLGCWNAGLLKKLDFGLSVRFWVSVRPGAAGLLIGIECSRVRDNTWMYLTFIVTTRIVVGLVDIQGNYST